MRPVFFFGLQKMFESFRFRDFLWVTSKEGRGWRF